MMKTSDLPLITIITVTRNAAHCMERCIQSVLNQSHERIEYIIIDGASSDGSLEIIQKYESRLSYWISEPDVGIYDAMNKGAARAAGDWIYFLGADDILVDCLHKIAPRLRNPRRVYYGDVYLPGKNKTYAGKFKFHTLISKNINHQAIFYPRRVFEKYTYNLKYKIWGDYDLNIRCWADREFRFQYLPELISLHNDGGVSQGIPDKDFLADKPALVKKAFGRKMALRRMALALKHRAGAAARGVLSSGKNRK